MKIRLVREIEAPDDATHYFGSLHERPIYVKCMQIGVAGDHWFEHTNDRGWVMLGHHKPHWIEEIPKDLIVSSTTNQEGAANETS